jgi:hypothetical protein
LLGSNPRFKRVCYGCGEDKTYVWKSKEGYTKYNWHLNRGTDLVLCHYCYVDIMQHEQHKERMSTRVSYRKDRIITHKVVRIGVCNLCRAVLPFDCKKTDLNHYTYNDNNPLEGILETCVSCHSKYHRERDKKQISDKMKVIMKEIWRKRKEGRDINNQTLLKI